MKNSPNRTETVPKISGMNSVAFAHAARVLSLVARELGHEAPSFRSPPRIAGARRSMTKRTDGSVCISVATRNRTAAAVIADMIEGIVVASSEAPSAVGALRDALWAAIDPQLSALLNATKAQPISQRAA